MSRQSRKKKGGLESMNRSFYKFGMKLRTGITDIIKDRDMYGQPISLNYKGSTTFRTVPGGLISLLLLSVVFAYTFVKGKTIIDKEDWSLIQ